MSKANRMKRERTLAPPPPPTKRSVGRTGVLIAVALALAVVVAVTAFALTGRSSKGTVGVVQVAGLQTGPAPWLPEISGLTSRLEAIGVPFSNMEGTALHIHPQLTLNVHGSEVAVPANIGISPADQAMAALHTHDESGMIHVESPVVRAYTLGEFFDVWGVRLTKQCLGGYCANSTNKLAAFVAGTLYTADPRTIKFVDGKQITLAFGTSAEIAQTKP